MKRARYFVAPVNNYGSLVDSTGAPLAKQRTWGVFDRHTRDADEEPRCVLDADTRTAAREGCATFNATDEHEHVAQALAIGAV